MAGLSLQCGDCGASLRTVEEAQEHAEVTGHANFVESTEAVLNLVCKSCGKPCRSKTEVDLHSKRTGHTDFADKTSESVAPLDLEKPRPQPMDLDTQVSDEKQEMVPPEVNEKLVEELISMGFSRNRAIRGLHATNNSESMEAVINWIVEHEGDPDIDEELLVPSSGSGSGSSKPALTPEEAKIKAAELVERARKKKEEEERLREREREKERIRIGKDLLEAKRKEEENERKRMVMFRKSEKEEEKRAKEKIRLKIEEDRAERRRKLGLPPEEPKKPEAPKPEETRAVVEPAASSSSVFRAPVASKSEELRSCLRSIKQAHKEDDARVKKAFQTLHTYIGNVGRAPQEEKFRKIRVTNPTFQERVGALGGGKFLELCGFEGDGSGEFLHLPQSRVDLQVLRAADKELSSAISNPFFGVL